jgi:hypothetical protein
MKRYGMSSMRFRSLLIFSLLILVAIAAFTIYSYFGRSGDQPQGANVDGNHSNIIWRISSEASDVPQKDASAIKKALENSTLFGFISPSRDLEIISGKVDGDQGVLYGRLRYHKSQEIVPTDGFALPIIKASGNWQVATQGDSNFCEVLRKLPTSVMSEEAKYYYVECRQQ